MLFEENQTGLLQPHDETHHGMMVKSKNDFWFVSGDSIYRHHVEHRVKLYVPTEESFPIPLKYIDFTRTTDTTLHVLSEKHIDDYWNVDEERELSDAWTGFTRFILSNERPLDGYTWYRQKLTRKQTTPRPDNVWPDMWKHMSDASKRKAKQTKWIVFFIEPDNEELKHTMKTARRKLEIPMPAAMPCKTPVNGRGETSRSIGKHKTKYACIVEADDSVRLRLEGVPKRYHEDRIAAKE